MSDHAPSTNPQPSLTFGRVASTIAVRDVARALTFYTGVLGMEVAFQNGDPVGFVILERDQAELHLTLARDHRSTTRNVAHLMVSNAAVLRDHLVANGTRIVKDLRDADYGLRGFVFADPDGNRLDVGQHLHPPTRAEAEASLANIEHVEAHLVVRDIDASVTFYERLGFRLEFTYGQPASFAQVRRHGARVNLRSVLSPVFIAGVRDRDELLAASFGLSSAAVLRDLAHALDKSGVNLHQPITEQPWGAWTFIIRDPDGNLLLFAAPATA